MNQIQLQKSFPIINNVAAIFPLTLNIITQSKIMMNKYLLILAITIFSTNLFGQDESWPMKGDSEIGIIVGFNASQYYGSDISSDEVDYSSGVIFGASYDHYFSDKWSLKVAAYYDQKGAKDPFAGDLNVNYLTIPINPNWHFGKRKRWFLNFGPYAGFLLSANAFGIDVKDSVKSTDFGFNTGIGIKIPIGNKLNFFIESTGQSGFTSVDAEDNTSVKNSRGSLAIGVFF